MRRPKARSTSTPPSRPGKSRNASPSLGERPVEWLLDHANVGPRWCLVHATHTTEREVRALAASGAVAGLCPLTEASLGDGIFDAAGYLAAGGAFGIGTDSNIQIDAAAELRQLEYGQRLARRARNVMTAGPESTGRRLFSTTLSSGAQALQRPIGGLAAGQRADIVVLDRDHADLAMRRDDAWLDAWIFVDRQSRGRDTVLVGGEVVVTAGRHRLRPAIESRYKAAIARVAGD